MDNLAPAIQAFFNAQTDPQVAAAAREFNVSEGTVLAALEGEVSSRLVDYDLLKLAEEMSGWGRLRLVVRNPTAVSEMLGTLEGVRIGKGWLTVENEHFHLHVKADEIREVFLFRRKAGAGVKPSYSVQFLNEKGEPVLKAFLLETSVGSLQVRRFEGLNRK